MSSLTLELLDGASQRALEGIASLVAEDASGQFGLQPGHAPLVTVLLPGLLRYRGEDGVWRFLACAGGPLRCRDNRVQLVSRRFLLAERPEQLEARLDQLLGEEHGVFSAEHRSHEALEQALMKRLREWSEGGHS